MNQLFIIGLIIILVIPIAILWVRGIDYMKENHPDYNGDDFLGADITENTNASLWENGPSHYEGDF